VLRSFFFFAICQKLGILRGEFVWEEVRIVGREPSIENAISFEEWQEDELFQYLFTFSRTS
jgi:hypothetical protein